MTDIRISLVVIRSSDIDRAAEFYRLLGLSLEKHRHGRGPFHYAAKLGSTVFEIYPRNSDSDATSSVRLGFAVGSVDATTALLQQVGTTIVSPPADSEWGRRAVVEDSDGHRIELTEQSMPH